MCKKESDVRDGEIYENCPKSIFPENRLWTSFKIILYFVLTVILAIKSNNCSTVLIHISTTNLTSNYICAHYISLFRWCFKELLASKTFTQWPRYEKKYFCTGHVSRLLINTQCEHVILCKLQDVFALYVGLLYIM